jgi:endonuclease/exonuclease/phosphatase family metal-dependent hydrolase
MSHDEKDTQAKSLPKTCKEMSRKQKKEYVCLENVVRSIQSARFDILALQEASNHPILLKKLGKLGYDKYIYNKSGDVGLLTLCRSERFRRLASYSSEIQRGSPFQVLLLSDKENNNRNICFINLYNGDGVDRTALEKALSNNLPEEITRPMRSEKYSILVAGDFHDRGKDYWKKLRPLRYAKDNRVVSSIKEPPKSCCKTRRTRLGDDRYYGDYILIDKPSKFAEPNRVLPSFQPDSKKFPTSDHLPVMAVVETD